jgi:hypothetical protein
MVAEVTDIEDFGVEPEQSEEGLAISRRLAKAHHDSRFFQGGILPERTGVSYAAQFSLFYDLATAHAACSDAWRKPSSSST